MRGPIAIIADADHYCLPCAQRLYPSAELMPGNWIAGEDREGNQIGALYGWESWEDGSGDCQALTCGDCGSVLDISHSEDCGSWSMQICPELAEWAVLSHMPGYMPESEPIYVLSWGEARDVLTWELSREADTLADTPQGAEIVRAWERAIREVGEAEPGESLSYALPLSDSPHDLGIVWELSRLVG